MVALEMHLPASRSASFPTKQGEVNGRADGESDCSLDVSMPGAHKTITAAADSAHRRCCSGIYGIKAGVAAFWRDLQYN